MRKSIFMVLMVLVLASFSIVASLYITAKYKSRLVVVDLAAIYENQYKKASQLSRSSQVRNSKKFNQILEQEIAKLYEEQNTIVLVKSAVVTKLPDFTDKLSKIINNKIEE